MVSKGEVAPARHVITETHPSLCGRGYPQRDKNAFRMIELQRTHIANTTEERRQHRAKDLKIVDRNGHIIGIAQ